MWYCMWFTPFASWRCNYAIPNHKAAYFCPTCHADIEFQRASKPHFWWWYLLYMFRQRPIQNNTQSVSWLQWYFHGHNTNHCRTRDNWELSILHSWPGTRHRHRNCEEVTQRTWLCELSLRVWPIPACDRAQLKSVLHSGLLVSIRSIISSRFIM